MKNILKVLFAMSLLSVCAGIVSAADESGTIQPATTEKYQKVRKQVDELANLPAGKRAPEVVEQAKKSITTAQEGLKNGNDRMTREYSEMAALQVILAVALTEERDASASAENSRKQLTLYENRLAIILSGKGDK